MIPGRSPSWAFTPSSAKWKQITSSREEWGWGAVAEVVITHLVVLGDCRADSEAV